MKSTISEVALLYPQASCFLVPMSSLLFMLLSGFHRVQNRPPQCINLKQCSLHFLSPQPMSFFVFHLSDPIGLVATFSPRFRCLTRALRYAFLPLFPSSWCSLYVSPQLTTPSFLPVVCSLQPSVLPLRHLRFVRFSHVIVIQTYLVFCIHSTTNNDFCSTDRKSVV